MKSLLIFDDHIDLQSIISFEYGSVDLFPLAGDYLLIEKVKEVVEAKASGPVRLLDSAKKINEEVSRLKRNICRWSSEVGETEVLSRKIKSWLKIPGSRASTWWFSLLSEKNNFKTDTFLKIAQANAIKEIVSSGGYNRIALSVNNWSFRRTLKKVVSLYGAQIKAFSSTLPKRNRELIKYALNQIGILGDLVYGVIIFRVFFLEMLLARRGLPPLAERMPKPNSLLFVSYFPAVDPKAAEKGVFKNKYYLPLQEKLKEWNRNYAWLLMHTPLFGKRLSESLELARAFTRNGERICFVSEFLTAGRLFSCLALWFRQIALSLILYPSARKSLLKDPATAECAPLLAKLWYQSFCGRIGVEGLLYHSAFRSAFAKLPQITEVLYCAEMHAWEKALNTAIRDEAQHTRTIGFQHVAISSNYLHFFYDQSETDALGEGTDLPLPDVLAVTGERTKSLLAASGYKNMVMVESIRHLYVNELLSAGSTKLRDEPVLLVAGSIDRKESKALAAFVYAAFPRTESFEIWFKAHPLCPFEALFEEQGIDQQEAGYVIKGGNIADALSASSVVFVPTSTVSIEALAFGCEVIIPLLPNSILMNPLSDYEEFYHSITTPSELKRTVEAILFEGRARDVSSYNSFVGEYWFTEPELPRWQALLRANS